MYHRYRNARARQESLRCAPATSSPRRPGARSSTPPSSCSRARGEDGLSIREVCARAGVTAPTIYHHFGDKAALVDRVVDDCFADFDRAFARTRARRPIRSRRCAGRFDRYVEYGLRHPDALPADVPAARAPADAGRPRLVRSAAAPRGGDRRRRPARRRRSRTRRPPSGRAVHGVTSLRRSAASAARRRPPSRSCATP